MKQFLLLLTVVLTGCSSIGSVDDYNSQVELVGESLEEHVPQMSFGESSAGQVSVELRSNISIDDPMFINHGYPANYDIYQYNLSQSGSYNIQVKAPNALISYDELVVIFPSVRVFDSSFREIMVGLGGIKEGEPEWTERYFLEGNWQIDIDEAGKYYVLIAPFNKDIGKLAFDIERSFLAVVGDQRISGPLGGQPVTIHPYGEYVLRITNVSELER